MQLSDPAYLRRLASTPLARYAALAPWALVARAAEHVRELLAALPAADYRIDGDIAIHRSAVIEAGAVLKGPLVIGPGCFIAAGAYLRGGNWLAEDCSLGPGVELKSSFVGRGSHLAHFNFVGDSVVGESVNLEAGSIVCNHRNERGGGEVLVRIGGTLRPIGIDKFGALIGDGVRIGANAVIAPGALITAGSVIGRGVVLDQEAPAR